MKFKYLFSRIFFPEHPMQIQIPDWRTKWEHFIPEYARSPTPGSPQKMNLRTMRERKSAIQKAVMESKKSARRKRDGKE